MFVCVKLCGRLFLKLSTQTGQCWVCYRMWTLTCVKDCASDVFPNIGIEACAQEKKRKNQLNALWKCENHSPFMFKRLWGVCSCLHLLSCYKITDINACTLVKWLLAIVEASLNSCCWSKLGLRRSDTIQSFFRRLCDLSVFLEGLPRSVWNLLFLSPKDLPFPWEVIRLVLKFHCALFDRNLSSVPSLYLALNTSTFIKSQTNWLTVPVQILFMFFFSSLSVKQL